MRDDGFIDLSGEARSWRWHRRTAPLLLVLLAGHLWSRFFAPDMPILNGPFFLVPFALLVIFHAETGIRHLFRLCPILWPKPGSRQIMTWVVAAERWCGLALAAFLAVHLVLVALSLTVLPGLHDRLAGTATNLAENGLLAVLAFHGVGGIRVLVQERLNTHRWDRILACLALVSAVALPMAVWLAR